MNTAEALHDLATDSDASSIISSMAVGFVEIDRRWRISQVNAAASAAVGTPADLLIGADFWRNFPGGRDLEFGRVYEAVMSTRRPAAFDAYYPLLDVWYELRVQPTAVGIATYFLDITARKLAEIRSVESAERARLVAEVVETLGASLDIVANVERLAELVVPRLGSWAIVSLTDGDGVLTDESWWHVDPARRDDVARYVEARRRAMPGTFAEEAIRCGRPVVMKTEASATIQQRLTDEQARRRLDVLAPQSAAVMPMVARGRTIGVLSIYSDVAVTEHLFAMAQDVAERAALSLDNSLAYERARLARAEAEAARAAAEDAGRRLALLARVSEALAGTADPDEAVGRLARLVVPDLADWSLVTMLDEERVLRDVAFAHRDPSRENEVAAYAAKRSVQMTTTAPLTTAIRTGEPVVFAAVSAALLDNAQPDPELVRVARGLHVHGAAIIPLTARGRVFGALTLVTTRERGSHTEDELAMAMEVAHRAGPVLDSARTAQRARRLAESMQRSLLAVAPSRPPLQISTRYRPAQVDNEVGGDWYDHFDLPNGSTVVTMGDVMGHDTAAIAAMAQLRTFVRASAWTGRHSPAEVLRDTDSASRALGPATFTTAITGELDPARPDGSVTLHWSNAGHLPPAVIAADGCVRYLQTTQVDVPLGVIAAAPRHDHVTVLEPGATLLLFTDGLIELRDRDIDAGLDHLRRVLSSLAVTGGVPDLEAFLDEVLAEMSTSAPHGDDIAMLAVRIDSADAGGHAGGRPDATDHLSVELPPDATAPAVARHSLDRITRGLPAEVIEDAALLTSELVSNALRHGRPPFIFEARRTGRHLRIGVHDPGEQRPDLPARPPSVDQPSGRGLIILDALAESWGVRADTPAAGKIVWFTLSTDV